MFGERQTRTLLGPADPVRPGAVAPPRLSAHDLIVLAEAAPAPVGGRRPARPTRRLVLAAGAAVALAAAGTVVYTSDDRIVKVPNIVDRPGDGDPANRVLLPIAYQFGENTAPAAEELRALAGRLEDAPYENSTGKYAYHSSKSWGDPLMGNGPYVMGMVSELRIWQAADGSGQQIRTELDPEYPDEASRDYWTRNPPQTTKKFPQVGGADQLPPTAIRPLPTDRAGLADLLKVEHGAGAVSKETMTVYGRYVVPRRTRAEILRVLADVPGFRWRGEVTDRVGRAGLAITFDDQVHDQQHLLIFNPKTGELTAHELVLLDPIQITNYTTLLHTDRTNTPG
ncbi:CU044_5270 family protein [Micromonospora sp. NPDC049523]|uniref:CU044_5270 family protein n=1 Tax=Micromonospora sp. NPDC049523 TaxID=3155921 RepID=UPI0034286CFF